MGKPYFISVPCGLTRTREIIELSDHVKTLGKDVRIHAYDTVQGLQWNGGRVIMNTLMAGTPFEDREQLYDVTVDNLPEAVRRVQMLNDRGIPFNLTINNVLESLDVDDEDGNYLLRNLENDMNWVTVATRALTQHVKANYPRFKMTGSICFAYGSLEDYARACEIYDLVVMMPFFAFLPDRVAELPIEKVSFILNDWCKLFCHRKEHYKAMGRCSLAGHHSKKDQEFNAQAHHCTYRQFPEYKWKLPDGLDMETFREIAEIADRHYQSEEASRQSSEELNYNISREARAGLMRVGVNHFKLQGREMVSKDFALKVASFLEDFVREEL